MLRVTIELVPHGQEDKCKTIGIATIFNDGTSKRPELGNYVGLFTTDKHEGMVYLDQHDRARNVWSLVYECLKLLEAKR
jgi:hypothetical protein